MKFSHLAAAAALVIGSGSGFAAVLTTPDLSTGSAFFGNTPIVGAFTDTLTFTLAGSNVFNGSVLSVVNGSQNVDFTSIVLTGPTTVSFTKSSSDPVEVWASPTAGATIAAGTYTLTLIGTNSLGQGSYAGNLAVTAVPEPQTWALMLAGVGLVGFLGRRRSV